MGTPKSLKEAIESGIMAAIRAHGRCGVLDADLVQRHVNDFLAQKFNAAMLGMDVLPEEEVRLLNLYKRTVA